MKLNQNDAFTLLEVLVALIVLSVGLTAAIISTIEITRNSLYLQDKTLAHWVAQNVLAEREMSATTPQNSGSSQMANQTWQWRVAARKTNNPHILEVEVTVSQNEQTYASLTGYEYVAEAGE